jgi:hypothetical protein
MSTNYFVDKGLVVSPRPPFKTKVPFFGRTDDICPALLLEMLNNDGKNSRCNWDVHEYPSCSTYLFMRFLKNTNQAIRYFYLLYLVPLLLQLYRNPRKANFRQSLIGLIRSSIYVSLHTGHCQTVYCLTKGIRQHKTPSEFWFINTGFIPGMVYTFLENERRRNELALFVLPKALEIAWNFVKKRKLVKNRPILVNLLFGLLFGYMFSLYRKKGEILKPSYSSLFQYLTGEKKPKNEDFVYQKEIKEEKFEEEKSPVK